MNPLLPKDQPVVPVSFLRKAIKAGAKDTQYRVTAYDTDESHMRQIVVVTDTVTEPTWVRHPERRSRVLCLLVADLDQLADCEHLTRLTNCRASFFGVRDLFTGDIVRTIARSEGRAPAEGTDADQAYLDAVDDDA